ncbi:MAG: BREX system ATP-binding domain-containing protein [Halobacteriota archaeon]
MDFYTIDNCPYSEIIGTTGGGKTLYRCHRYNIQIVEGDLRCISCLEFMNFELKYQNLFKDLKSNREEYDREIINNSIISSLYGGVPPEIRYCSLVCAGRRTELENAKRLITDNKGCTVYIEGEFREGKSFFLRLLCDSFLSNSNQFCTSLVELDDYTNFYDYPAIIRRVIQNLLTPDYRGKHKYFSNGLDALIYRFIFRCYGDFEKRHERSSQLHSLDEVLEEIKKLFSEILFYKNNRRPIDDFLDNAILSSGDYSVFAEHFPEDKIRSNNATDLLQFIFFLCEKCGYKLVILFDELEKSFHDFKHFESISSFLEMFPEIYFVFSGTHNLLAGGTDSIEKVHSKLFHHFNEHLINLEEMKKEDFVDLIRTLEGILPPPQKNYFKEKMENKGGYKTFVEQFLLEDPNKTIGAFLIYFKEVLKLSNNSKSQQK